MPLYPSTDITAAAPAKKTPELTMEQKAAECDRLVEENKQLKLKNSMLEAKFSNVMLVVASKNIQLRDARNAHVAAERKVCEMTLSNISLNGRKRSSDSMAGECATNENEATKKQKRDM